VKNENGDVMVHCNIYNIEKKSTLALGACGINNNMQSNVVTKRFDTMQNKKDFCFFCFCVYSSLVLVCLIDI
jgi:hypothetical protein